MSETAMTCSGCGKEQDAKKTTAAGRPALPYKWTRTRDGDPVCQKCKAAGPVRNYSYGCKEPRGESEALIDQQMRLAYRFRNDLVDVERERRKRVDETMAAFNPDLAEIEAQIALADPVLKTSRGAIRAGNSRARRKTKGTPEQRAATADADQTLKALRARRAAIRKAMFADPATKARLAAHEDWAKAEHHRLYNDTYAALYWGTRTYLTEIAKKFRKGAPPERSKNRDDGHIVVQIQGGATPAEVTDGTHTQFRLESLNDHPRKPHAVARLRVGSGRSNRVPVWVEVRLRLHRPLPDGCRIKQVHLIRRREGIKDLWSLVLGLENVPGKGDQARAGTMAVDVGWRRLPGRGLRVAYWAGSDGREGEVVLSEDYVRRCQKIDELAAVRKLLFNTAHARLRAWVEAHPLPPHWTEKTAENPHPPAAGLGLWKSEARLRRFVEYLRDNRLPGDDALYGDHAAWQAVRHASGNLAYHAVVKAAAQEGVLAAWRLQDRHLLEYKCGLTRRTRAHRREVFRLFAAGSRPATGVRQRYRTVVMEDINWREEILKKPAAEADTQAKTLRMYHRMAAPGLLLAVLAEHAAEVVRVPAPGTTVVCHRCGGVCEFDQAKVLVHTCEHCAAVWDQDRNAALNLLEGRGFAPAEAAEPARVV